MLRLRAIYKTFFWGLFLLPIFLFGQDHYVQVSGLVKNKADGNMLEGVKITNLTRPSVSMSNASGVFSIVAVPGDKIRFSHLSMDSYFITVPKNAGKSYFEVVELNIDPEEIERVLIERLPAWADLADSLMNYDIPPDAARELAERHPDVFTILDTVVAHEPSLLRFKNGKVESSPISWFYEKVIKKIRERQPKPEKKATLPKFRKREKEISN